MAGSDDVRLLGALRTAARSLSSVLESDRDAAIRQVVEAAVDTVAPADGAGISQTADGTVQSAYATDGDVHRLDHLQSELAQGPCITAADRPPPGGVVHARDLGGDDHERWPLFASQAVSLGYRSLLSLQLSDVPGHHSALNLYAHEPDAFDEEARTTATLFSLQAAMLLHGRGQAENLRRALETRDLIGQAKGVLIERFRIGEGDAFQMLVAASQATDIKLVEVARWVLTDARRASGGPISGPQPPGSQSLGTQPPGSQSLGTQPPGPRPSGRRREPPRRPGRERR